MIGELQGKEVRVEVGDDSLRAHAEISFPGGTSREAARTPLLAVIRCLGDNLSGARELLSPGELFHSKNYPAGVENSSARRDNSRADKSFDSEGDRVDDSHLIKGRKQSRRSSQKLPWVLVIDKDLSQPERKLRDAGRMGHAGPDGFARNMLVAAE